MALPEQVLEAGVGAGVGRESIRCDGENVRMGWSCNGYWQVTSERSSISKAKENG